MQTRCTSDDDVVDDNVVYDDVDDNHVNDDGCSTGVADDESVRKHTCSIFKPSHSVNCPGWG